MAQRTVAFHKASVAAYTKRSLYHGGAVHVCQIRS